MEEGIMLGDVSSTSLLTLYCHAIETQSRDPILVDPKSVEIAGILDGTLSRSDNRLYRNLSQRRIKRQLVTHIAIRAKRYDDYARDFLLRNPGGVVVNIGCGMDFRFPRVDNGKAVFFDLDLPEVIGLKKRFSEESARYHMIASSVFDYGWLSKVSGLKGPFLFMAEGVFMYLPPEDVKTLVLTLQKTFPGSELVCEVFNSFWLRKSLAGIMHYKFKKEFYLGDDAMFRFAVKDASEMAGWGRGIELMDEWSYFDSDEKKLGLERLLGRIELFRKTQWTLHYMLN
jgi:O-methyltransferase involved in polyketide biosynthesis